VKSCVGRCGQETEPWAVELDAITETDRDADLRVGPGESTSDVVAFYQRACAAADASIAAHSLTDTGTSWTGETVSLRWVLIHMLEETARHVGHMDIIRELIDGAAGDHDRPADN
jgi:Protein of unknown function (DUF664)